MELVETGEKRDRVGRKITPASRREELVGAWQRSGLTQAEFARREGVRYPTFASWVQQARAASGARKSAVSKVRFAETGVRKPEYGVRLWGLVRSRNSDTR